jgi:hypothetical protein
VRLDEINSDRAPGKYSLLSLNPNSVEKRLCDNVRRTLRLPNWVFDEMIHRQLSWCKYKNMSIEEAKAHLLKTYIDDINDRISQETKDINAKVMEGYKGGSRQSD